MAFPDYGPLKEIAQFTQDGFAQGSFMFQMFAGEIQNTMSLHYIGLTFALMGAMAIVFIKKFHNFATIASWTFLVFILLIGPRNSPAFFTKIKTNTKQGVITEVTAYTPQAVVVDFMSKIHRAIYLGFFDIANPTNPRGRNIIEDYTRVVSASDSVHMSLLERVDIQQEVLAYKALKCGNPNDLSLALHNQAWQILVGDLANDPLAANVPVNDYQLSIKQSYDLQQKTFKMKDVMTLLSLNAAGFSKRLEPVYAPFGVIYTSSENLMKSFEASGVSEENRQRAGTIFSTTKAQYLADELLTLSYAITNRDRAALNGIIGSGAGGSVVLLNNSKDIKGPIIAGYITNKNALVDHIYPDLTNSPNPLFTLLKRFSPTGVISSIIMDGTIPEEADPIEQRLKKVRTTGFSDRNSEILTWMDHVYKNRLGVPVALGFLTPSMQNIYKNRAQQSIAAQAKRDISKLSKWPYFNVLNNCAQLHHMVRTHIRDALLFQNAWPSHYNQVTVSKGEAASLKTKTALTGNLGMFMGLSNMTGPNKSYQFYPYDVNNFDHAGENKSMVSISTRVQQIAQAFTYQVPNSDVEYSALDGSSTKKDIFAEILRRAVIKSIIDEGINNTNMPHVKISYSVRASVDATEGVVAPRTSLDRAMTSSFGPDMVAKNIPSLGSGFLGEITEWVAKIATKIGAEFTGVGAVAFVRFIQLFIGIAIFFILMCTPILYMMGLVIPAHAPGVILTSIIALLALKAIPIGYTLVDATMTAAMKNYDGLAFSSVDRALMIYVTATAYTSVTLITFFLLFKAGDTQAVLGQISNLDSKANEIANTAASIVKGVAGAAALAVTAGVGGAAGAAMAGNKGKALSTGLSQAKEVFGKNGLAAIPGAGNAFQEVTGSYREGKGESNIRAEVDSANKEIQGNSSLSSSEKSDRIKSYGQLVSSNKDAIAENKYRGQVSGGQKHFDEARAHKEGERIAKDRGTSMEQISRENREAGVNNSVYSSIGEAAKNTKMEGAQVQMTGSEIKIDAAAARAIQMGMDQGDRLNKQADPKYAENARQREIQRDVKSETDNILGSQVEGKAAKEVKAAVTIDVFDGDGNVIGQKSVLQEAMYDQAAGDLKKSVQAENDPALAGSTPNTLKNVSELVSAKHLAAHSKGEYEDGSPFKMRLQPEVADVLQKHGKLDTIVNSRNAGDLWIDPNGNDDALYNDLKSLKSGDGKQMFGGAAGHSISLFNQHLANNPRAKQEMKDGVIEQNKKLSLDQRNS